MSYPVTRLTDHDREFAEEVACQFSEDAENEDGEQDIFFVDGSVWVAVDPITDTISFAMDDREFSIKRQLLADTINKLWPIEQRKIERHFDSKS